MGINGLIVIVAILVIVNVALLVLNLALIRKSVWDTSRLASGTGGQGMITGKKTETGSVAYSAEASSLGWRPGYHPDAISFKGKTFSLLHEEVEDGDVKFWEYVEMSCDPEFRLVAAANGDKITVFND